MNISFHPMLTHSKVCSYKPKVYIVVGDLTMTMPILVKQALSNELWRELITNTKRHN